VDDETALLEAAKIAVACVEGRLTPLQTGRAIVDDINPWQAAWDALGGADGKLSSFYAAMDKADELHFLGADVERWHPAR
jgi:hypothetical protein